MTTTTSAAHRGTIEWLDRTLYPNHGNNWDIQIFADRLRTAIQPGDWVLDLGAGRGHRPELDLRPYAGRVCAVDPDEAVLTNEQVHEAKVLDGPDLPYPDATFDVLLSTHVWEHVEDPARFLAEARRVLKPGGCYLSLTPNRYHYVGLVTAATPHAFHEWFNETRGRHQRDTFPTFHRLNSRGSIRRAAAAAGFSAAHTESHEHRPEYLRFSAPTYLLGAAWERLANSIPQLEGLRVSLLTTLIA